jgi:hypothetical protein
MKTKLTRRRCLEICRDEGTSSVLCRRAIATYKALLARRRQSASISDSEGRNQTVKAPG